MYRYQREGTAAWFTSDASRKGKQSEKAVSYGEAVHMGSTVLLAGSL